MFGKEYYFSFKIDRLELINTIQLQTSTCFKLQIYRNNRMVASTPSFLCVLNQQSQIPFYGEIMKLKFYLESGSSKLLQIPEECPEIVIGRYEFLLKNYIKAYEEFHKNRIELSVQIGLNYYIHYDVFIENSEQAVARIIKEYQTAKKFNIYPDQISQIQSFLPHQVTNENLEEIYKEIKIDEESPLLLSQRFWSPKRKNSRHLKKDSIISLTCEKAQEQMTTHSIFDHRISLLKLNKQASSSSQIKQNKLHQHHINAAQLDGLSQQSQTSSHNWLELYQVIQSQSKIIFNQDLSSNACTNKQEQTIIVNSKRGKRSLRKYSNTVPYFILVLLIITVLSFFVFLFERPTLSFSRQRRPLKKI